MSRSFPEFFSETPHTAMLIDGAIVADYRISTNEMNCELFVSQPMINFIFSGSKIVKFNDQCEYASANECFFVRQGRYIMSTIIANEDVPYYSLLIFLNPDHIRGFIAEHEDLFPVTMNTPDTQQFAIPFSPQLKSVLESLILYFDFDNLYKSRIVKHKIFEILLTMIADDPEFSVRNSLLAIAESSNRGLTTFMETNYHLPLTIPEFAEKTARSLTRFKSDFRQTYDSTPKRWINERRLEKAHSSLLTTDNSISEISFLCGFESPSHFIKLFREKFATTPHQFKINRNRDFSAQNR